ncbi:hypothetical protein HPB50_009549 [Hyalomma asiaticum]|uniref:Uncharacterized protein n=1 Tax=Hyalomma asiaticum TaxID=266040 RepID=A0ACB7T9P7_HYAAI|nr:hypothetical protein HPB50_009549 [Hyalomma asiaticum]
MATTISEGHHIDGLSFHSPNATQAEEVAIALAAAHRTARVIITDSRFGSSQYQHDTIASLAAQPLQAASGSGSSYAQALAKKIPLSLPDQHFNITVGEGPDGLTYRFNLTDGKLYTKRAPTVLNCHKKPNRETTCRISMVGWRAQYSGTVTNSSEATDNFNVTATIKEYTHPPNPAQLEVSSSGAG